MNRRVVILAEINPGPAILGFPAAVTIGTPFTFTPEGSGGSPPYVWGFEGTLPDGYTWDAASHTISGTSTEIGSFAIAITIKDAQRIKRRREYVLRISPLPLVITNSAPDGQVADPYDFTYTTAGGFGAKTFAVVGTLPDGLVLEANGRLHGTPTVDATFDFAITATDSLGATATVDESVQIDPDPAAQYLDDIVPAGWLAVAHYKRKWRGYAGSVLRARRTSDSAEQSIGLTGDTINTAALETFSSGGDATAVRLYDQSGNGNDLFEATAAKQPPIVAAGTSLDRLEFDRTAPHALRMNQPGYSGTAVTVLMQMAQTSTLTSTQVLFELAGDYNAQNNALALYDDGAGNWVMAMRGSTLYSQVAFANPSGGTLGGLTLIYDRAAGAAVDQLRMWWDGVQQTGTVLFDNTFAGAFGDYDTFVGARNEGSTYPSDLRLRGVAIFDGDLGADRADCEESFGA